MRFIWHYMKYINICVNLCSECFTHTKVGEFTVYHNDGNQHKASFEKRGSNVGEGTCEQIRSQLSAVGKHL